MPKFDVEFKHIEEITYKGWVEADTEEEAHQKVYDEPFDIEDLHDVNYQGLEVIDIHVREMDED